MNGTLHLRPALCACALTIGALAASAPALCRPATGKAHAPKPASMTVERIVARGPNGQRLGTLVVPSLVAVQRDVGRPVIFAFNGGPGAASAWLQLGLLGPLRVVLPDDPAKPIPPSPPLERTNDGLWDVADIVFIDPLGTGFSRVDAEVPMAKVEDWRIDGDYIAGAIRDWLARHGRTDQPVLLIGESYGTERAVAVADALTRGDHPVRLAGVVLVSQSITVENTLQRSGNDLGTAIGLPTIAATACYWAKAKGAPTACAAAAQDYALDQYLPALAAGDHLPLERRAAVERQMSLITGLPADQFTRNGLSLTKDAYRRLALAKEGRLLGVYDSRYAAAVDPARKGQDPSFDALLPAMEDAAARANRMLLGLSASPVDGSAYRLLDLRLGEQWGYGGLADPYRSLDMMGVLARSLRRSGGRLMIAGGLFDTAGSYGADRYLASHIDLPRDAVDLASYEGGHMFYLNGNSRRAFLVALRTFTTRTTGDRK